MKYLYKERCKKCCGIGTIQLTKPEICESCNNINSSNCYLCEKRGGIITMKECSLCSGYGELFFDSKTNQQKYLYALQNYKIIS